MSTLRPGHLYFLNGCNFGPNLIRARSNRLLIGRNPGNHLVLEVPEADPLHCKIYRSVDTILIRNYSRENPIQLNGFQIHDERPICHGDMIEVAGFVFLWQYGVRPGQRVRWIPADDECDFPLHRIKVYLSRDADRAVSIRYIGRGKPPARLGSEGIDSTNEDVLDEPELITQMSEKERCVEGVKKELNTLHRDNVDEDGGTHSLQLAEHKQEQDPGNVYSELVRFDSFEYMQNPIKDSGDLTDLGTVVEGMVIKVDPECDEPNEEEKHYVPPKFAIANDLNEIDDHNGFVPLSTDYEEFEFEEAEFETDPDFNSNDVETEDADESIDEEFENVHLEHEDQEQPEIQHEVVEQLEPVVSSAAVVLQAELNSLERSWLPAMKQENSDDVECEEYVVQSFPTEQFDVQLNSSSIRMDSLADGYIRQEEKYVEHPEIIDLTGDD